MPIRAITFDLDDTLWPIAPVIERAERLMYQWLARNCPGLTRHHDIESLRRMRLGIDQQQPGIRHDFALMRRAVLRQAMAPLGYDEAMIEAAYQVFFAARNQVELYSDVRPALAQLSSRYRLGALSNGNADLQQIGLSEILVFAIHACDVGYLKPHPKMFQAVIDHLDLPACEILHVGDHLGHDVAGARDAGMQVVWINRSSKQSEPSELATISSLAQLPELLDLLD